MLCARRDHQRSVAFEDCAGCMCTQIGEERGRILCRSIDLLRVYADVWYVCMLFAGCWTGIPVIRECIRKVFRLTYEDTGVASILRPGAFQSRTLFNTPIHCPLALVSHGEQRSLCGLYVGCIGEDWRKLQMSAPRFGSDGRGDYMCRRSQW